MRAWQRRIDRADELARRDHAGGALLRTYGQLLAVQRDCYEMLRRRGEALNGSVERDASDLRTCAAQAFARVAAIVPPHLGATAPADEESIDALLREGWQAASPPFYARLVLQPYAECLANVGTSPVGRAVTLPSGTAACPFCGGPPQLSILRSETAADGGGRSLLCSACATTWPLRRVLCPGCGEDDERRLGYFHTPDFEHLRVDACESCRGYLKTIDLTRDGRAVPLVDEVAAGALDVWAAERGYRKLEVNLVGL